MDVMTAAFLDELAKIGRALKGSPKWPVFKRNRVPLEPEERALVMKRKAVWRFSPKNVPTSAVSKSVVDGKTWYETHTHRAMDMAPTLKGAIRRYHDFIKGTA